MQYLTPENKAKLSAFKARVTPNAPPRAFRGGRKYITKREVKKMLDKNTEWKAIYTHKEGEDLYNGGVGRMYLLNGCNNTAPLGLSSRIGREILNRSVQIHIKHRPSNVAAPSYNFTIRCVLFIDLEPHGVAPTPANLFNTAESQGYDEAFRNLNYRNRFIILKDKFYNLDNYDNNGTLMKFHDHKFCYQKLNFKTTFNSGTAATIADIEKGALYFWAINAEATYSPLIYLSAVVRFTDE